MQSEFVSWDLLASFGGALGMVVLITQFTKNLPIVSKLPTQIWSYVVALAVLYPAYLFTGRLNAGNAVLIFFNGVLVALASNGGFEVMSKAFPTVFRRGSGEV